MARTRVPTPHGPVFFHLYHNNRDNKEHLAIVVDPAQLQEDAPSVAPHIRSRTLEAVWSESETEMDVVDFAHEPSPQSSAVVLKGKVPAGTYHSVTCTPDQFPNVLRPRRPTKLCIAVTMYNEPLTMFTETIEAYALLASSRSKEATEPIFQAFAKTSPS